MNTKCGGKHPFAMPNTHRWEKWFMNITNKYLRSRLLSRMAGEGTIGPGMGSVVEEERGPALRAEMAFPRGT